MSGLKSVRSRCREADRSRPRDARVQNDIAPRGSTRAGESLRARHPIRHLISRRTLDMKRMFALVALLLTTGFISHGLAQGVQTGIIRGIVKDQQGLVMPGVTVTVTSQALQGQRLVVTGTNGGFTLQSLPPGAYEARFELPGFAPGSPTGPVPLGGVVGGAMT